MLFRWLFTAFVLARSGAERMCNDAAAAGGLSSGVAHMVAVVGLACCAVGTKRGPQRPHTLDPRVRAKPRADLA